MSRAEFSAKIKLAAFGRAEGYCDGCSAKLHPGRWHCDHVVPCGLGGEATLENAQVLCEPCHRDKTGSRDVPAIAKAKRLERRAAGIRKPTRFACSRDSKWKKKL